MVEDQSQTLALTVNELRNRTNGHVYTSYLNMSFLIKSGVFTAASLSVIKIYDLNDAWAMADLSSLWLASAGLSTITLVTWSRGALLTNGRADWLDSLYPLLIGICEYALFLVLEPGQLSRWSIWYLFAAAHALLAYLLVQHRSALTDPGSDFCGDLQELATKYKEWMKRDARPALIFSGGCLLFFFLRGFFPSHGTLVDIVASIVVIGVSMQVSISASQQYNQILREIQKLLENSTKGPSTTEKGPVRSYGPEPRGEASP